MFTEESVDGAEADAVLMGQLTSRGSLVVAGDQLASVCGR